MRRVAVLVGLLAAAGPASARELNAQGVLLGERASGMGGAFTALTGDPVSSYYNPAGVAALHAKGVSLSASAYQLAIESYPKLLDINDPSAPGEPLASEMKSSTVATFPSSIVYVLPLDKAKAPGSLHQVLTFSVLVPQIDKLTAKISTPQGVWAFDLAGTYKNQETTYWVGPSYGVQIRGKLRLGVSAFALAHLADTDAKIGMKMTTNNGLVDVNGYTSSTVERTGTAATALLQAGIQYDLTDRLTLGVTVRSPTMGRLYSSASMVEIDSFYEEDANTLAPLGGYVDRVEADKGIKADYRRPLFVAAGVSYHVKDRFTLALDGSFQAKQSRYKAFDGTLLYPVDPSGNPITTRPVDLVEWAPATKQVLNANLGLEVNLTPKLLGRFGAFTDFSVVDRKVDDDPTHPALDRFGVSLGLGRLGEKSTTSFGVVYVYGAGKAPGLNALLGGPANEMQVTAHTVTAVLSGSADL